MNLNLLRSKTDNILNVVSILSGSVFKDNKAADRMLASFFKANKKYGSNDRKQLYKIVFAFFRWFGWTRLLVYKKNRGDISFIDTFQYTDFLRCALFSVLLEENIEEDALVSYWLKELRLDSSLLTESRKAKTIKEKAEFIKKVTLNESVGIEELIPEWAALKLNSDLNRHRLIESFQTRPPVWIRLQTDNFKSVTDELDRNSVTYSFHERIKNALRIDKAEKSLYNLDSFNKGFFEIQDIASQVIGNVTGAQAGQRWWDCCAGAGGKTLQISSMMQNKGRVVATDIREYKLEDLRKRYRRAGLSNIEAKVWDGDALRKKKSASFDGVLIDAPCSCSGTWRRNPDARWTTNSKDVEEMSSIQKNILLSAASAVKVGGTLVYATCSIFDDENSYVVKEFLAENENYKLEPFINPLDGNAAEGMLQVYPWFADCDAMFVAKMRKME